MILSPFLNGLPPFQRIENQDTSTHKSDTLNRFLIGVSASVGIFQQFYKTLLLTERFETADNELIFINLFF